MKKKFKEQVEPIKNINKLHNYLNELLKHKNGREYYTIFEVGMRLCLRASDILKLRYNQVFNSDGSINQEVSTKDKKTGKFNVLDFSILTNQLILYKHWMKKNNIKSFYLFPAPTNKTKPMSRISYYYELKRIANFVGIKHVGTHTARKTGAYLLYKSTGNIALVMNILNHSSEKITLRYLGLNGKVKHNALSNLWRNK